MKSICLFAAYFVEEDIPYPVTVYLKELKKHFQEVVLICSQKKLSNGAFQFLEKEKISLMIEENRGFDFGLWYRAFQKLTIGDYDQIALVNDSCILFKPLDEFMIWAKNNEADVKGITQSDAISPHLQSYFLLLNQTAVQATAEYFKTHEILDSITQVIVKYEVGLSKQLQDKGLTISSFLDNNNYRGEFSPYYHCVDYHLAKGIPTIKKKIIFGSYRKSELFTLARMNFKINREYYFKQIKSQTSELIIDLDKLRAHPFEMTVTEQARYNAMRVFINLAKPFYKLIKGA